MATKTTGWLCTHLTEVISNSATSATIRVTCFWKNNGWTYNINYVNAWVYCNGVAKQVMSSGSVNAQSSTSASVTLGYADFTISKSTSLQKISCYAKITSNSSYVSGTKSSTATTEQVTAKTSYPVKYNANGGSGAPGTQTKWYGTTLKLSTTKPTRTGYTFAGWATSSTGSVAYAAGANYTANAAVTLYAKWTANTYKVTFNANGGSGAPAAQTKTYGTNLTLSSTKPTRTNYNFLGWATSASATSATYAAGGTYSANAAVTLYAVWQLAYTKPRITNVSVYRCDSSGNANDAGTYFKTIFTWASDKTVSSITVAYTPSGGSTTTRTMSSTYATGTFTGTGGTVTTIASKFSSIDIDKTYNVVITVTDSVGSNSYPTSLASRKFKIDTAYDRSTGNIGVAVGKAVETMGVFDSALPIHTTGGFHNVQNGVTTEIVSYNSYYTHYQTSCAHHWFNKPVCVQGDVYAGSSYNRRLMYSDGDTMTGPLTSAYSLMFTALNHNMGNIRIAGAAGAASVTDKTGSSWIGFYNTAADAQNNTNRHGYFGFGATDTNHMYIVNECTNSDAYIIFRIKNNGSAAGVILQQSINNTYYNAHFNPETTNKTTLGTSDRRWYQLFQYASAISTSDEREKHDIAPFTDLPEELVAEDGSNKLETIFGRLKPKVYRMREGEQKLCIGFVAQDIAKVFDEIGIDESYLNMLSHDYNVDKETGEESDLYSLAYTEFIALQTHMIQKQQKEIDELKSRIEKLEKLLTKEE